MALGFVQHLPDGIERTEGGGEGMIERLRLIPRQEKNVVKNCHHFVQSHFSLLSPSWKSVHRFTFQKF